MKLRFRNNTLRLRVNQQEVRDLALGQSISEQVHFPGSAHFTYSLTPRRSAQSSASFQNGTIAVEAALAEVEQWAASSEIGIYFDLPAGENKQLRVSIEKDLECLDEPVSERDPDAFPRLSERSC